MRRRSGLQVDLDKIPVLPEGAVLCREFGLDPLGTIASGSILLTAPQPGAERLIDVLTEAGYPSVIIGRVTPPSGGLIGHREAVRSCPGRNLRRMRSPGFSSDGSAGRTSQAQGSSFVFSPSPIRSMNNVSE